jgi:hypothetical protein
MIGSGSSYALMPYRQTSVLVESLIWDGSKRCNLRFQAFIEYPYTTLNTPPTFPEEEESHKVGTPPTGVWIGHSGEIATWRDAAYVYEDYPTDGISDLKVYRNGLELTEGPSADYQILSSYIDRTTVVQLNTTQNIADSEIAEFTAIYTPAYFYHRQVLEEYLFDSTTGDIKKYYLNDEKTVWLTQDKTLNFSLSGVSYSKIYLCIIMRRVSEFVNKSPVLDLYKLYISGADNAS